MLDRKILLGMSESSNLTSSLETFVKSLLLTAIQEVKHNLTKKHEGTSSQDDTAGAVTFIMVFIAIFSFFIVSVLVIAIRSHSYDQLEDQYVNNCNMPESRLSSPVYLQGAKCTIHENKTAN
ncbi:potassium voltage-gated channel subfamily E member 2-like isoform X1 [Dendropsophus ebraccatus]|uniref:potassium voltage-gated channel subfamily E member 2-like isoform X1 n=1 Tax=Dendropsophus ebraccatus TaxID=150705 RepID=UPI0038312AF0